MWHPHITWANTCVSMTHPSLGHPLSTACNFATVFQPVPSSLCPRLALSLSTTPCSLAPQLSKPARKPNLTRCRQLRASPVFPLILPRVLLTFPGLLSSTNVPAGTRSVPDVMHPTQAYAE
jgi:hypothetical protein